MNPSNTHIIISPKDFLGVHTYKPIEVHMRSLEKYLDKNNRIFTFEGNMCVVQVYDKQDAIRLGMENKLRKIVYVEGSTQETLSLVGKSSSKRTNVIVSDIHGIKTSLRKIKQQPRLEAKNNSLTKGDIVKRMILTKKELDDAIKTSQLNVTLIGKKSYINKEELRAFISKKK